MTYDEAVREWLIEHVSVTYSYRPFREAFRRFRQMGLFYGREQMRKWGAPEQMRKWSQSL